MKNEEHNLQVACINWLRLQHPNTFIFAIPNGGARNAVTGAMLKAEGVVAGVPDLFIAEACGGWNGLFIEMKTKKGVLSERQKNVIAVLKQRGYLTAVCRSFEDFRQVCTAYLENAIVKR